MCRFFCSEQPTKLYIDNTMELSCVIKDYHQKVRLASDNWLSGSKILFEKATIFKAAQKLVVSICLIS
jgi:hypothetical protein